MSRDECAWKRLVNHLLDTVPRPLDDSGDPGVQLRRPRQPEVAERVLEFLAEFGPRSIGFRGSGLMANRCDGVAKTRIEIAKRDVVQGTRRAQSVDFRPLTATPRPLIRRGLRVENTRCQARR